MTSDTTTTPMTAAEFRIARERLGVTGDWLAGQLGVEPRAVRRWESGDRVIVEERAQQIRQIIEATDTFIEQIVDELEASGERDIVTYPSDKAYRAEHPDLIWPASWHRAAMGRVAELVEGAPVRIRYIADEDADDALNDWHATVTIAAETPDLADDRQRRLVTDWLETYATDTNEDLDALLARIRRPSTQRAKPETSQVTPDGRSWGWLQ